MQELPKYDEQLAQARAGWLAEFPGEGMVVRTRREDLVCADLARTRLRDSVMMFERGMGGVPMCAWAAEDVRKFGAMQRMSVRAQRLFNRLLDLMQRTVKEEVMTAKTSVMTTGAAAAAAPVDEDAGKARLTQSAVVTVVGGKTVTKVDLDAKFWVEREFWQFATLIQRQFEFPGAVVPEEYDYVLTHEGVTREAQDRMWVVYKPDEFARLCKLELEKGDGHLLDGERLDSWVRDKGLRTADSKLESEK